MMKKSASGVRSGSKTGVRPAAKAKVSDMMELETKKMEEKLALVKRMMDMEKNKGSTLTDSG